MIYGYARVSTNHQDTELQLTALKSAGCEKIFEEHASGRKSNRPVLKRLIATMQPGDELVVWKLDRIGRNVLHALLMFQQLQEKGINFRSIPMAWISKQPAAAITFVTSFPQHNMNLILIANVP